MAEFLTTVANSYNIEKIIKKAKNELTIVTPYLKLTPNILERILDADTKGVLITIIYGKSELTKFEQEKLQLLNNIEVYFLENLHAKCYHNENNMVISSMNLYEFSERNNREMGILIDSEYDKMIFEDAIEEVQSIKNAATLKKQFSKKSKIVKNSFINIQDYITKYPEWQKNDICYYNSLLTEFYKIYKTKYKIECNEYGLLIHNFPEKGIFLEAGYSLSFNVPNPETYFLYKEKNRDNIRKELRGIRIFRNKLKVQVYHEKDYNPGKDDRGIKSRVEKTFKIINTFYNYWSE